MRSRGAHQAFHTIKPEVPRLANSDVMQAFSLCTAVPRRDIVVAAEILGQDTLVARRRVCFRLFWVICFMFLFSLKRENVNGYFFYFTINSRVNRVFSKLLPWSVQQ